MVDTFYITFVTSTSEIKKCVPFLFSLFCSLLDHIYTNLSGDKPGGKQREFLCFSQFVKMCCLSFARFFFSNSPSV
jgi:hypothetical protein